MFIDLLNKQVDGNWSTFFLEGFSTPVTGFFHTKKNPANNGMAFGSVDTGSFDIESDGTLGLATAFNSVAPRRGPINLPLFGISCGTESFVLSIKQLKEYPEDTLKRTHEKRGVPVDDILYFGHYPMLDMQYLLDAPIEVSSRMYVPFIPGNAKDSNVPGGIIEFYVKNISDKDIEGNICMSFPGPSPEEVCGNLNFEHTVEQVDNGYLLTVKNSDDIGYCLGVTGATRFENGGCLGVEGGYWSHIGIDKHPSLGHEYRLPYAYNQPGGSILAGYSVKAHETVKVTFVLSWYAAIWNSGGSPLSQVRGFVNLRTKENCNKQYVHMYEKWFDGPLAVAEYLLKNVESIKRRIIAWQEVIYGNKTLPGWLQDALINSFYLITEDGMWAQAKAPVGDWCREEDGLFGMNECPRGCPQMECIPCSFYGSLPLVYFFPDLALSTLRGYKAYQYKDGATPWVFGGCTTGSALYDLTTPSRGYQITTNGISYAVMVDRLVRFTKDPELLHEFYDSLKRNMIYTIQLNPEPDGIISMPNRLVSENGDLESEWFEGCTWDGMVAHAGGLHIAQLRILERMAEEYGDTAFQKQCSDWIAQAQTSMEEKMWTGSYYLNFHNEATGHKSDLIFGYQLDGEWITRFHGLKNVFDKERVTKALKTIEENNTRLTAWGAINYTTSIGEVAYGGEGGLGFGYDSFDFFPPELLMLAMTYMLDGQQEFGLELAKRCMKEIICSQGKSFNSPNLIRGDRTESTFGNDYYQMLMIWGLPSALEGKSIEQSGEENSFINQIIKAAN